MPLVNHAFARMTSFSRGLSSKPLFFLGLEQNSSFSPFSSKPPPFGRGQRHGLPKAPFVGPDKSEGCLNQSFPGVTKGGIKGELTTERGVGEGTGPEGERGGKNEGKGWEERGPKAHSKNSDLGTPMI